MRVRVTESFNTAKGNIPKDAIIEIPETMLDRLKGKVEPLHIVADAILRQTVIDIDYGGVWKSTPDVKALEDEINRLYRLLMDGLTTLTAFRETVDQWKTAGTKITKH
ncbi:MAG: hypothetical protein ABFD75_02050 [Smithella sp.]